MSKKKVFGVRIHKDGELSEKGGFVEYKMSNLMAKQIVKAHKGAKKRPQEILCDYVNKELGLKGHCVKVLIEL
jgi:hypothetical protein